MNLPAFPEAINDEIPAEEFLSASKHVLKIIDNFGKILMPLKYDMKGNIDKLSKKLYQYHDNFVSLQSLLIEEQKRKDTMIIQESLLWLLRYLSMIQLFFEFLIKDITKNDSEDLVVHLTKSYGLILEPSHGYTAQQLFTLLARGIPTRTQLIKAISFGCCEDDTMKNIEKFTGKLKKNVMVLAKFYEENDLGYI